MKKLKYTLAVSCLFLAFACQTDDQGLENLQNSDVQTEINSLSGKAQTPSPTLSDEELLEARMQWLSFIAVKVIMNNSQARNEVAALNPVNNRITATTLFSNNAPTFNAKFRDFLEIYILNAEDGEPKTPPGAAVPTCCFGPGIDDLVQNMIDYWTLENCIELYFPNGITTGTPLTKATSTAHPLTDADKNSGFVRYTNQTGQTTGETLVNEQYVITGNTFVVAAVPFRNPFNANCGYLEGPVALIDFEEFLDGTAN